MHSTLRSFLKKHGRSLMLVAMVTSMMLYVVSRDKPGAGALREANDLITITLDKEELQDILNKKEERQDIPAQTSIHDDRGSKKIDKVIEIKIDQPIPDNVSVEPIKDNTNVHKDKPAQRKLQIMEQKRLEFFSRFKNSNFVVIKNKVYQKKDLNSTAAQAALKSLGLVGEPDEEVPDKELIWPAVMEHSGAAQLRQIDLSNYNAEDRSFLESRMEVYEQRARQVGAACDTRPDDQRNNPRYTHLVWDTIHHPNIVFCPNYKVASTTWMMYFLRMVHFNEDNPKIAKLPPEKRDAARFLKKYGAKQSKVAEYYIPPSTPEMKLAVFKQALRVIIVRHPFTRILSAYRDKMIKMIPRPAEFKFRDLQLEIIAKYRKPDSDEKSPHPTFSEFIQHVIDSTANLTTSRDWQHNVHCWTPFWTQCEVCSFDFNFIMKLETMVDDEHFLITMSNLKELKEMKQMDWRHKKETGSSFDVAPDFYKQITQKQMRMLYQRYKLDFELYDYHIDNYLAIAKDA